MLCKFIFVPSGELSEDGSFDGQLVMEVAHQSEPPNAFEDGPEEPSWHGDLCHL